MPGVPGTTLEYNTDTSRAIFSLINDGGGRSSMPSMATRYADLTFIWSHAGGTLVGLVGRILGDAASGENIANQPRETPDCFISAASTTTRPVPPIRWRCKL